MGAGGFVQDQVGAQAVALFIYAAARNGLGHRVADGDFAEQLARIKAPPRQLFLLTVKRRAKFPGVFFKRAPPRHHLGAQLRRLHCLRHHRQAEAVQKLRPQLALVRVHGANQNKTRRVAVGNAVAFHKVDAAGGRVQKNVHQVVGEEVDFVHVQHAAVGARQEAGGEGNSAVGQRAAEVQGAGHHFLGGAQGQVDESAAAHHRRQAARRRGFGAAALALHQHAADGRVHPGQLQREHQLRLADDGGEGVLRRRRLRC